MVQDCPSAAARNASPILVTLLDLTKRTRLAETEVPSLNSNSNRNSVYSRIERLDQPARGKDNSRLINGIKTKLGKFKT